MPPPQNTTLPAELLMLIFEIISDDGFSSFDTVNAGEWPMAVAGRHERGAVQDSQLVQRTHKTLRAASITCRSWRRPAQICMLRTVMLLSLLHGRHVIRRLQSLYALLSTSPAALGDLRGAVKKLTVRVGSDEQQVQWTNLVSVLNLCSRLRHLVLYTDPGSDHGAIPHLPSLTHLTYNIRPITPSPSLPNGLGILSSSKEICTNLHYLNITSYPGFPTPHAAFPCLPNLRELRTCAPITFESPATMIVEKLVITCYIGAASAAFTELAHGIRVLVLCQPSPSNLDIIHNTVDLQLLVVGTYRIDRISRARMPQTLRHFAVLNNSATLSDLNHLPDSLAFENITTVTWYSDQIMMPCISCGRDHPNASEIAFAVRKRWFARRGISFKIGCFEHDILSVPLRYL